MRGAFTRVAAETLDGLGIAYDGVDPKPEAIEISKTMLEGLRGEYRFHECTGAEFIENWRGKPGSVGMVYMDHGESSEKAAWMHVDDARSILDSGMLAPGGLVLIDDHSLQDRADENGSTTPSGSKRLRRSPDAALPKSRYSRRIFEDAGFTVLAEGAQLLLQAPAPPPKYGHIPKVIHQTWKSHFIGDPFRLEWVDSWKEINAPDGWEYRLWTDADLEAFVAAEFPDFFDTYLRYDIHIKRIDAARYLILKRLGGVFVDLDFACLRPLDELLGDASLLFGLQSDQSPNSADAESNGNQPSICNAFMASAAGHPFWNCIEFDLERTCKAYVLGATGPDFLTDRVSAAGRFFGAEAMPGILAKNALYPFLWDDPVKHEAERMSLEQLREAYPDSYAVTFWTAVWKETTKPAPLPRQYPVHQRLTFSLVLITADRSPRQSYCSETLASLARSDLFNSDLDYSLTICDSGTGDGGVGFIEQAIEASVPEDARDKVEVVATNERLTPNQNCESALRRGAEKAGGDGWVIFLEDDLNFCGDWLGGVERWLCRHATEKRRLYLLGSVGDSSDDAHGSARDYAIDGFYGTQCYALRSEDARTVSDYSERIYRQYKGHDMMLKEWAYAHYPQIDSFLASVPSFVQHIGIESAVDSASFHQFASFPGEDWVYAEQVDAAESSSDGEP